MIELDPSPGKALAPIIAKAGVAQLIATDIKTHLRWPVTYRPSSNARIPRLAKRASGR